MSPRETRKDIFLELIRNADKFPSIDKDGKEIPLCWMEAIILAKLAADWVETGDVPDEEDWNEFADEVEDAIEEAEHATKQ